jgi:TolA-binding protein
LALLVVAWLSYTSCAYYNTFFFAKKHYNEAGRAREARKDDKASALEIQHYEKCIRQCSKVLAEYPNSKYVDDALFLTANSYYWWGRYLEAMKWYRQLVERYPESELVPEVRLMIAECHVALREYVEAENLLTELFSSPAALEKDQILFALAEVYGGRGDDDLAIRNLRKLLEDFPKSKFRLESKLALGDAYFSKGVYDSAAMSYEDVARGSGEKEQRVEARKRMGQALYASGDAQAALDIYAALLLTVERPITRKQRVKDPQEAALVLKIGECQNALGDHERAIEMFLRVMTDFQSSTWAAEAEFLTGYTYEIYYEDLDRAKTSYDRVPSHSQLSVFVNEAKRRGEGLGKLREYIAKRDEGEEGEAEDLAAQGGFLSAELNLFELSKPEDALDLYRQVERDYPDSPYAPKAAYAAAWVLVNRLNRDEEGYDEYRRILIKYPYSDYADGARRVLDMEPLAAILQGPPLPEGWSLPDSSAVGEGLEAPGAADTTVGAIGAGSVADTTGAPGIAMTDTSVVGQTFPGGPDSLGGTPGLSPVADTTGAPSDTTGLPLVTESEPTGLPGGGGAPEDTSAGGTGNPPAGEGSPPGVGTGPADTSGVTPEAPPDTTAPGAAGEDSTGYGVPGGAGAADSTGSGAEGGTTSVPADSTRPGGSAGTSSAPGDSARSESGAGTIPAPGDSASP